MNQHQLLQEIASLLEIVLEETEAISGHTGKVPQIELDLVMSNVRKLYQAYYDLNSLNAKEGGRPAIQPMTQEPETGLAVSAEPILEADLQEPEAQTTPPPSIQKIEMPPVNPVAPVATTVPEAPLEQPRYTIPKRPADFSPLVEKTEPVAIKEQKEKTARVSASETIADKLKTNQLSLHDKLESAKNGSTLAEKLQQHRIQDIKAALGINERFLFLNELFKGDTSAFEEAMDSLNTFGAFPEAAVYLNHLAGRYAWKQDGEAYQALVSITKRRYL